MAVNCAACRDEMKTTQKINCSACNVSYHPECVNLIDFHKLSSNVILGWKCPACQNKMPKKDNSNTPVRSSAPASGAPDDASRSNVTLRAQNRPADKRSQSKVSTPDNDPLTALTREIRLLRDDMTEVKKHLKNITNCVAQCTSRLDDFEAKFTCFDARIRALEEKELENALLHERVYQLEEQLNFQAQISVRNEIEILGINEHPNENLAHVARVVAAKIGVKLDEADIDDILRVGPRRGAGGTAANGTESGASFPRPVVLRFVRRMKRKEFLKSAKSRRNITSTDIEVAGQTRKLFINERLTKKNRYLFRQARQQKSTQGYMHCWTNDGHILIRKKEGSPVIQIQRAADLDKILKADLACSPAGTSAAGGSHPYEDSSKDAVSPPGSGARVNVC